MASGEKGQDERYTDEALAESERQNAFYRHKHALKELGLTEEELAQVRAERSRAKDQSTMRQEMSAARVTWDGIERDPEPVAKALDKLVGAPQPDQVIVLQIIQEGRNLTLGLDQWQIVQELIAAGVWAGRTQQRR